MSSAPVAGVTQEKPSPRWEMKEVTVPESSPARSTGVE